MSLYKIMKIPDIYKKFKGEGRLASSILYHDGSEELSILLRLVVLDALLLHNNYVQPCGYNDKEDGIYYYGDRVNLSAVMRRGIIFK